MKVKQRIRFLGSSMHGYSFVISNSQSCSICNTRRSSIGVWIRTVTSFARLGHCNWYSYCIKPFKSWSGCSLHVSSIKFPIKYLSKMIFYYLSFIIWRLSYMDYQMILQQTLLIWIKWNKGTITQLVNWQLVDVVNATVMHQGLFFTNCHKKIELSWWPVLRHWKYTKKN